ncbi:MAG: hypothetical protein B7X04_02375 [Parcubacteria group bacterium 21-54-25]|nr:MAG: hypothetical protein B7X04_02375 [Parcubacteria group bacterium 21-54-25]HQU07893.1 hypothetical protein [Candidatus Paceibacterota bacterium]
MLIYVHQFLNALVFSALVEGAVVLLLCLLLRKGRQTILATISVAVFGTMGTIPYVWFVFPTIFWYSANTALYTAEGFAFVAEALLYRFVGKLSMRQAFLFSLLANAASYFLGRVLFG